MDFGSKAVVPRRGKPGFRAPATGPKMMQQVDMVRTRPVVPEKLDGLTLY